MARPAKSGPLLQTTLPATATAGQAAAFAARAGFKKIPGCLQQPAEADVTNFSAIICA
jgi:hypothetical protein